MAQRLRRMATYAVIFICVLLVIGGCGDRPPKPSVVASTPSAAEVAESRRFRESFGLPSDDPWIISVANDPSSEAGLEQFGVPLLPSELTDLVSRTRASSEAGPVIVNYAATVPDDWYGWYIDQEHGGVVVAQFFRNAEQHREALARLLPPSVRWEVRQVDERTLDMIAFVARVKSDPAWFRSIDAELLDVVANPLEGGNVELTYIAASRDLDSVILAHFGSPEWLRVERSGGPPWAGPVGDLVVKAIYPSGSPAQGLTCSLGNPPQLTDSNGICRYQDLAAIGYRVELWSGIEESRQVAGSGTVSVKPNQSTSIMILVKEP